MIVLEAFSIRWHATLDRTTGAEDVTMHRTSVLLVEDHPIFREGLRRILSGQEDLQVVGETDTASGALEQVRALRPAIVLLDLGLKDGSGLEALPRMLEECPKTRVIVLTGYDQERGLPALRRGARGFVSKDTASTQILEAIRAVLRGEIWAVPQATGQLVDELFERDRQREVERSLTAREQEVLRLVGEGKRNAEIARALFISENTVKTHVSSLMNKLEIDDRIQLALYAARASRHVR
jgi:NarL family two-component system response regulator LiaR